MGLTRGNDDSLWFVEIMGNKIGKITISGEITEYDIPTPNARPHAITAGAETDLWFTEWGANKIGRLTREQSFEEYPIKTSNGEPHGIGCDKDGNVWFALECNKIGKLSLLK